MNNRAAVASLWRFFVFDRDKNKKATLLQVAPSLSFLIDYPISGD
ncbi:hypothetical protein KCO_13527 [Pectobacterium brasiliense ICMP 19477]|nr:hypothetical protein KCO_13527 [Pectobacterium brasiliense ICMP 19477]